MHKIIIVSLAIIGLSTSAALAKKHHAKKPAASTAAMNSTSGPTNASPLGGPMGFGATSSADREMYLRNKRESGMK
jgi:hypothetical protein